ncbi:hypothetical protein CTEN210_18200 [Chaetoceros tenuissimus]|uniref:Uncharacterized protein n=1 Tax=Chaetoceros tenuissimus TaxID=426638 RepID=A0AAD3DFJ6_9STRA|nr:hypothetical protein CTEN210_18200 [Chaetoceros tenuissimus]
MLYFLLFSLSLVLFFPSNSHGFVVVNLLRLHPNVAASASCTPHVPPLQQTKGTKTRTDITNIMVYKKKKTNLYAISPSSSSNNDPYSNMSPRQLVSIGMNEFKQANIHKSIELFDLADSLVPNSALTPYLWQRGISLYYNHDFQQGSLQFRYDVKVNPLDVEEIVWDIACQNQLQLQNPEYEIKKMALPQGQKDRRRIMSVVYNLFRGDATEAELAKAGHEGNPSDLFYALFYLGLYCESIGEISKAEHYMKEAVKSEYANGRGDYMTSCARVHSLVYVM